MPKLVLTIKSFLRNPLMDKKESKTKLKPVVAWVLKMSSLLVAPTPMAAEAQQKGSPYMTPHVVVLGMLMHALSCTASIWPGWCLHNNARQDCISGHVTGNQTPVCLQWQTWHASSREAAEVQLEQYFWIDGEFYMPDNNSGILWAEHEQHGRLK